MICNMLIKMAQNTKIKSLINSVFIASRILVNTNITGYKFKLILDLYAVVRYLKVVNVFLFIIYLLYRHITFYSLWQKM